MRAWLRGMLVPFGHAPLLWSPGDWRLTLLLSAQQSRMPWPSGKRQGKVEGPGAMPWGLLRSMFQLFGSGVQRSPHYQERGNPLCR